MFTFKISVLLYPYFVFLAIWMIFFAASIYHAVKFGFKNIITIVSLIIFIFTAMLILYVSFEYLGQVDWEQNITLLENNSRFIND